MRIITTRNILYILFFLLVPLIANCSHVTGADRSQALSDSEIGKLSIYIYVDVPDELASYTGIQPVTFGLPFKDEQLLTTERVRLVDANGSEIPAQFEVLNTYESGSVKWLLIDFLVSIEKGVPPDIFLELDPDTSELETSKELVVKTNDNVIEVSTGVNTYTFNKSGTSVGQFTLEDGAGNVYHTGQNAISEQIVEKEGPIRAVVKRSGEYTSYDGAKLGEFITRYRFYSGLPFVRIYHTMIWTEDDSVRVGGLSFNLAEGSDVTSVWAGVDGGSLSPVSTLNLTQISWDEVIDSGGKVVGNHWDGWVKLGDESKDIFVAVRWPWQQFPMGVEVKGKDRQLKLIGPKEPMSLEAKDIVMEDMLTRDFNEKWDLSNNIGPYGKISPRGVSKTYEILIWNSSSDNISPGIKNALLQKPIFAYADPLHVASVGLPIPMSAANALEFPEYEKALQNSFHWATREEAEDNDYGIWNYGDIQYDWNGRYATEDWMTSTSKRGYVLYRYWMNYGKGWNIVPWLLFLRSGGREYFENAEARSRHLMDVDTCHVDYEGDTISDMKVKGGVYHYSTMHWDLTPRVEYFSVESEYLPLYYYLTGYERAWDVMLERADWLATNEPKTNLHDDQNLRDYYKENPLNVGRQVYRMLSEFMVLYEATRYPRLMELARMYLDLTLGAQRESGRFPNPLTNFYIEESLNMAIRFFGPSEVFPALKRWQDYRGSAEGLGTYGDLLLPESLWTLISIYQQTGDMSYLRAAVKHANAQVLRVIDDDSEWRGLSTIPVQELGPAMRDWIIVMAALAQMNPEERPTELSPQFHFHGNLKPSTKQLANGWENRHVILILDADDMPFDVDLNFHLRNFGEEPANVSIRSHRPDGTVKLDSVTIQTKYEGIEGNQVAKLAFPKDGMMGVYAIEVLSLKGRAATPVSAMSSTGKVVHYLPTTTYVPQWRMFPTSQWSGQAWFQPEPGQTVVVVSPGGSSLNELYAGVRTIIWDQSGNEVCRSTITGTHDGVFPIGEPCSFDAPDTIEAPYAILVGGLSGADELLSWQGVKPFVSSRREEWFDPTEYMTSPINEFLNSL